MSVEIPDGLKFHLKNTKAAELCPLYHKTWMINDESTLHDALSYMFEYKILSIPIYKKVRTQFSAFIDLFDILFHIKDCLDDHIRVGEILSSTKCLDILSNNPKSCVSAQGHISIQDAINLLSKSSIRRIAVLDEKGHFDSVLSQSRIVRYLGNRPECDLGGLVQTPVGNMRIGSSPVTTINKNDKVINAFLTILKNDVGGIAVVNNKNKLIGNISISDLRAIGTEGELCRKFSLTCKEFILQNRVHNLVTVTASDRFMSVLWYLRSRWLHRIYLVNDEEKKEPMKVIAISDVLRLFVDI